MDLNCTDQAVYFGTSGSGDYLARQLARIEGARILCVTGRESYRRSGAAGLMADVLKENTSGRFSEFSANPTLDELEAGLAYSRRFCPDAIIAIGGGSVLDMAKLINFFGSTRLEPREYLHKAASDVSGNFLPMIAIPTTAGTGSEATCFSVLYENQTKYSVEHPGMLPTVAILNPELTESMTPYQVACCGFDAFSQAIESYWAVGSTERSRQYSAKAIFLCMSHLEDSVLNPSAMHRRGMMEAAYLAGKAIHIAKTTAAHALSYTLTAHYGLPHGHAVAMMLPSVFALNSATAIPDVNDSRGQEFVRNSIDDLCGMLGDGTPDATARFLQVLCDRIGLDRSWLKDLGIDIEKMHAHIVNDVNETRLGNNPRTMNADSLQWVASQVY